jgi:hypothetical protein
MRYGRWAFLALLLLAQGCGYHRASGKFDGGAGRTIAIPTFTNTTTTFRVERRITEAIRREFIEKTQFRVTSEANGDLIVTGVVHGFGQTPIFFDDRGRASAYNMGVDLGVTIKDGKTGQILHQSRESMNAPFELARSSTDFVPEDSAALDRLARRFASTLVASLLQTNR